MTRDWLADLLPSPPALVVDIGSGTGRDAGAFAAAGYDVIAVEPSEGMRAEATRLHPLARIRWLPDSLPGLATVGRLGLAAHVVLLSAVWQHVASVDRPRAFRKLVGLLRSGGLLVMTLRHGPDDGRGGHAVSLEEVEALARQHGLQVLRVIGTEDLQQRPDITWTSVVLRLPDDGTAPCPCCAISSSLMPRARPTSSACCGRCAAPRTGPRAGRRRTARTISGCPWD